MVFIPPNREEISTKSFLNDLGRHIFVVPIAFRVLYNILHTHTCDQT